MPDPGRPARGRRPRPPPAGRRSRPCDGARQRPGDRVHAAAVPRCPPRPDRRGRLVARSCAHRAGLERLPDPACGPGSVGAMDVGRVGIWTGQLDLQPAARARGGGRARRAGLRGAVGARGRRSRRGHPRGGAARRHRSHGGRHRRRQHLRPAAQRHRDGAAAAGRRLGRPLPPRSGGQPRPDGRGHAQAELGQAARPHAVVPRRPRRRLHGVAGPGRGSAPCARRPGAQDAASWRRLAWGALTYFVPVEHTRSPASTSATGPMLLVEQAAVLSTDPEVARRRPQAHGRLPHAAQLREQPAAPRLGRRRPGRRRQRRPGRRAGGVGRARAIAARVPARTTRRAPTTCASRCSTPTSPPCRSSSGGRWHRRCWRAEPNRPRPAQAARRNPRCGVPRSDR